MRLQWWSNAPWASTGYGTQTAQVCRRLIADGHQVSISANYGLQASTVDWEGAQVYPAGMDAYSQDVIIAHWRDWAARSTDPTLLMTLFDVWILKNEHFDEVPLVASWVPIDHLPAPREVADWCARPNVAPIAMAKFGADMLNAAGIDHLYVPHGIEDIYQPTYTLPTGSSPRDLIGVDNDAFVVMINAANKGVVPCRKAFPEMFQAFKVFSEIHSEAILYLHTDPNPGPAGIDLDLLAAACRINPDRIRKVDTYALRRNVITADMLAAFYTAADVLLATSMGEGFGIPVLEAQACGTRVIVSDWTAQPELVGDGWEVPVQPWWDQAQKAWFGVPAVPAIVEALERAYQADRGPSQRAIDHAAGYNADVVYRDYWRPALDRLQEQLCAATTV